ncbi:hypothetical protein H7I94_08100 [Mycobacterium szulgai]|nr:hypothetical protein [Mycobacterium szulgai]
MSAPGVAALGEEVNPDLLLAQRVLGGLVRGCERWPAPIAWAVSVVKTPVGSQVLVASSLGGGSYLPATVFLPATARLAVVDPALPFGWAHGWMGCQKPSKILVDHFEHLQKRVVGASISAMVTTELRPDRPAGVADFAGFQHIDALYLVPAAPSLDGAHQHRLAALDPVLAQRVSAIDAKDGHLSAYAAAQLTAAVIQAAAQPDPTGEPLATADEGNILASVQRGLPMRCRGSCMTSWLIDVTAVIFCRRIRARHGIAMVRSCITRASCGTATSTMWVGWSSLSSYGGAVPFRRWQKSLIAVCRPVSGRWWRRWSAQLSNRSSSFPGGQHE